MFLASGSISGKEATCGPSANHKTSVCRKSEDLSAEDFRKEYLKAKCRQKCLDAAWSSSHECSPVGAKCGETGHVSACHKHHEADTELYECIRKESRNRKGSSASGLSSAKKSKPAPKEDPKDLENQLEKARLEGIREGLEKREASLSSSQRAEVVNSKDKERLPRTPPPRRRKTRVNQGRKSEDIRKRVLTVVGKI